MRICFYAGYRDLKGGFTTLLLTLIRELTAMGQEVVLINFAKGLIADELKKSNTPINLVDMDTVPWKDMDQHIFNTDVIVAVKFVEPYRHFLKINPRVVYYDINDYICNISDYKYGIKYPGLGKKLIQQLLSKKGLVFMDDTGMYNLQQYFSIRVADPVFLPIPVNAISENLYLKKICTAVDTVHFTYVGRSVDWKMMPLKKILDDCAHSDCAVNIQFTIVVDSIKSMEQYISLPDYLVYKHLHIELIENMLPSQIDDFLIQRADLHFAMGTAALDAAKMGIPTVLVDYSIKPFPDSYRYLWIFESKCFSLGRNLDKISHSGHISINRLISEILDRSNRINLSDNCYEYVQQYHTVNTVAKELIHACNNTSFRLRDAKSYVPFYFKAHGLVKSIARLFTKSVE